MSKYYSEQIEKNTQNREEYARGIESFLNNVKIAAQKRREQFITPEKYFIDSEKYRESFVGMLGFPLQEKRETPTLIEKQFVSLDGNVNIYRVRLRFWDEINFYGLYFEQAQSPENAPFIIGLHGGEGTPELVSSIHMDSSNYNHMIRRLTDKGANVFVPQLLLWSKEIYGGEYDRVRVDGKLRMLGGSITALELYLLRGSLDYFIGNEKINAEKIGACGMSYGGMYALHLAALDTRIKACYSCSWICDGFVRSWADWSYKNAQNTFAVAETAALVCPRVLAVGMGDRDSLFDSQLTAKEWERVLPYYTAFGKEDNLKLVVYEGEHEFEKMSVGIDFLLMSL